MEKQEEKQEEKQDQEQVTIITSDQLRIEFSRDLAIELFGLFADLFDEYHDLTEVTLEIKEKDWVSLITLFSTGIYDTKINGNLRELAMVCTYLDVKEQYLDAVLDAVTRALGEDYLILKKLAMDDLLFPEKLNSKRRLRCKDRSTSNGTVYRCTRIPLGNFSYCSTCLPRHKNNERK